MKKFVVLAVFTACLACFESCRHEPPITPFGGNTTTGGNNNNNNPTGNCNPDSVYFENDILPLLNSSCGVPGCHDAATHTERINVTSYAALMNSDIIKPGNPKGSDLIDVITEKDPNKRMPQPPRPPLTQEQINKLTKWVQQGARNNRCNSGCDTNQFAFAANVKPIIEGNCKGCHSSIAPSGNVALDTHGGVKTQADNGKLLGVITHSPGFKPMPQGGNKLPDCEIAIIRRWVNNGAPNN